MKKDYKDKGLRLIRKGQQGMVHAIFSRFGLILFLLFIQVRILFDFFQWFENFLPHVMGGRVLFTFGMVIYLLNSRLNPTAKITWLIVIMLLPVFGVLLFCYTQSNIGHQIRVFVKKWVNAVIAETKTSILQDADVLKRFAQENEGAASLARYMRRSGCFPVYENTAVTYFPSGEDKFQEMLVRLAAAKH